MNIAIFGYGRVGRALARALHRAGHLITGVVEIRPVGDDWLSAINIPVFEDIADLPESTNFILICVPDGKIPEAAGQIAANAKVQRGAIIAHTAGALTADVLAPVRERGCLALAWHPLQTFTGDDEEGILTGVCFGMDGDPAAMEVGETLARDVGGVPMRISPEFRGLYHIGGVFASNFVAALAAAAQELLSEAGFDREQALAALEPLMNRTVANIARLGLPEALTGPVKRGDVGTIRSHLQALEGQEDLRELYRMLSRELLRFSGVEDENIKVIRKLLQEDQQRKRPAC